VADILLVNPPVSSPYQPLLAIPALTGYLKSKGFRVDVQDLSIDGFHFITSKLFLQDAVTRICNRAVKGDDQLLKRFYKTKSLALTLGPAIIENIDQAKRIMQDREQFYDYSKYTFAHWILNGVPEILHAAFFPTRIGDSKAFYSTYQIDKKQTVPNILTHVSDAESNIFLDYFLNAVVPDIKRRNPAVIGISITFPSQLLPALTLCRLLSQKIPDIPLILGGGYLTALTGRLETEKFLWDFAAGIVFYEGETALAEICSHIKEGRDLTGIPNLFHKHDPIALHDIHIEDIQQLPPPDFSGIPWGRYLIPEPIVPMQSNKGCYWGKCAFCSDLKQSRWLYRQIPVRRFIQHMESVHASTGAITFLFCDLATPVTFMKDLANHIRSENKSYTWYSSARFESQLDEKTCRLLADGGCLDLLFGLESASERVLKRMRKGTKLPDIIRVLKACKKAGINAVVSSMVGFPGETVQDAQMTEQFLIKNRDLYFAHVVSRFHADEGSDVILYPDQYNIAIKEESRNEITPSYEFVTHEGMTPRDADKQYMKISTHVFVSTAKTIGASTTFTPTEHYLLYRRRFGNEYLKSLETAQDVSEINLNTSLIAARSEVIIQQIDDEESLVYKPCGPFLVIPNPVARAVHLLQNHLQPLSQVMIQAFEGNIMEDKAQMEIFYEDLLILILLIRYNLLEYRGDNIKYTDNT